MAEVADQSYTYKKLSDVEDSAPKFGMGELQEARFATDDLCAEDTGVRSSRDAITIPTASDETAISRA